MPSAELVLAGLLLIAIVAAIVTRPLLAGGGGDADAVDAVASDRRAALEAAKEAKYREIRDAELDFRMGKLSKPDYRATDAELRAQAIEILKQLDALDGRAPGADEATRS